MARTVISLTSLLVLVSAFYFEAKTRYDLKKSDQVYIVKKFGKFLIMMKVGILFLSSAVVGVSYIRHLPR